MIRCKYVSVFILLLMLCCNVKANEAEFFIKDTEKYSDSFLEEFKNRHAVYETVALIEDTIIINNDREDFIIIPTDLPLEEEVIYQFEENSILYSLTVKRINISTIEYNYYKKSKGQIMDSKQGTADLQPVFYFGAEGIFEDQYGDIYGMNKYYIDYEKDDYLLIGVGSIEKSSLIMQTDNGIIEIPFARIK